jgi:hypothetical protein
LKDYVSTGNPPSAIIESLQQIAGQQFGEDYTKIENLVG